MHCNILTLNTALATHVDDTQIFNVIQLRKKGLAIGNINSLRAGSLGEREPARIPITFTCMRPIFGRRALIG